MRFVFSLAILNLIFVEISYSQIIYSNITDTTVIAPDDSWTPYNIELNNDDFDDYLFNYHNMKKSINYQKIELITLHYDAEILCSYSDNYFPSSLNKGESIDPMNSIWYYPIGFMLFLNENEVVGTWIGANDKFLAVKLRISGNWYYGWISVGIPEDAGSYTIKNFACNSIFDNEINAGELSNVIVEHEYFSDLIKIRINNSKIIFTISNPISSYEKLSIYNRLRELIISDKFDWELDELYYSGFSAGVYFVKLDANNFQHTKKLILNQ